MILLLSSIAATLALISTILVLYEKDVAKAVVLAGVESVFYALLLQVFLAPDLLIAYVGIGLGLFILSIIQLGLVECREIANYTCREIPRIHTRRVFYLHLNGV